MRVIPLLLAGLVALAPAFAAGAEKASGGKSDEKAEGKGKPGNNVDLPFLMAPMTNAEGNLAGYAYISSLLVASGPTEALAVRDKLAFLQDAFVRDINGAPVATAADITKVDIPAVQARLLADARRIMGAAKVKGVLVCTVQVTDLRPKQTPDLHTPPKDPLSQGSKDGKAAQKSPCDA